ncbi:hypothetical protein DPM13_07235 [Paracoccus mutanolyticus]|uniref:Uncharacterized protein n=1 Tax=Paracoccus mutanolyticus TaxID=1499308 RepID=A0ABN5MD65_9RHOB|nr:hypothetical protein DPM13_07235 [Paracoccus mutanolyticus]
MGLDFGAASGGGVAQLDLGLDLDLGTLTERQARISFWRSTVRRVSMRYRPAGESISQVTRSSGPVSTPARFCMNPARLAGSRHIR